MKISWKALLLAPAAFPAVCSALFMLTTSGGDKIVGFLVLFALGAVISYGATVVLLLPALSLLARLTSLTLAKAATLGALLGALAVLPMAWVMWKSSGPDSGPPVDSFIDHLVRDISDPLLLIFPMGGLVTAMLYWTLAAAKSDTAG